MPHHPLRSAKLTRRDVVRLGVVPFLGLNLPGLLAADESGKAVGKPKREKSCIMIYQYGGLSQIDSWDPKPDGPSEYRGPYRAIETSVPGFRVGELMPRLATIADKYAVIRSMNHNIPVHDVANTMLLAGKVLPPRDSPSFGAIVTKLKPSTAGVPSHVWLQKFGGGAMPPDYTYLSGGFLGASHAPLLIGQGHEDNPSNPAHRVTAFDMEQGLTIDRVRSRVDLLKALDVGLEVPATKSSHESFRHRSLDLLTGSTAREAFEIDSEPDLMRDRYGRNPLGQNLLLARRLIEAGVRLVNVVAWCGLAPGDTFMSPETWDMHGNAGVDIFGNGWNGLGHALPICDQGVAALLEDLDARGLLDTTLVVLVGEFGRTPKISRGAISMGRDHWSNCYSAMIAGAGVRGGAVHGATDKQGAYVTDRPVSLEDFTATLLHALDIEPGTPIHPDGFSVRASTGNPIHSLFG